MGSIQNTVHYCCVFRGNRNLYVYSGGDDEIENLAALSLERIPAYHKWYFETIGKRTFGFLIEDGYVYFIIVDEGLGNSAVLHFLEHVRDEFKKMYQLIVKLEPEIHLLLDSAYPEYVRISLRQGINFNLAKHCCGANLLPDDMR
ncbi:hypothetical protein GH714_019952 [Hevea brasiliensis]|uniref:Longin domain-containing protein n=1 Tax=Hevea brasiliensis TaxID=3981 RepID=A0A6A6LB46_HEVBR|nr:hypothetical protein GH714_019952 [Hevea brasiliensis]